MVAAGTNNIRVNPLNHCITLYVSNAVYGRWPVGSLTRGNLGALRSKIAVGTGLGQFTFSLG